MKDYTQDELDAIFRDDKTSEETREKLKPLLPTKTYDEVSFYDQDGSPKFGVGSLLFDGDGHFWLIIK